MEKTKLQEVREAARAEREEFKRFAKEARKVGLLVSRQSYDLYFRNNPALQAEVSE